MGLTIAIILLSGVYLIALRPKQLSWSEVGFKPFTVKIGNHNHLFCHLICWFRHHRRFDQFYRQIVGEQQNRGHAAKCNVLYDTDLLYLCCDYLTVIRRDFLSGFLISLVAYTYRIYWSSLT